MFDYLRVWVWSFHAATWDLYYSFLFHSLLCHYETIRKISHDIPINVAKPVINQPQIHHT